MQGYDNRTQKAIFFPGLSVFFPDISASPLRKDRIPNRISLIHKKIPRNRSGSGGEGGGESVLAEHGQRARVLDRVHSGKRMRKRGLRKHRGGRHLIRPFGEFFLKQFPKIMRKKEARRGSAGQGGGRRRADARQGRPRSRWRPPYGCGIPLAGTTQVSVSRTTELFSVFLRIAPKGKAWRRGVRGYALAFGGGRMERNPFPYGKPSPPAAIPLSF